MATPKVIILSGHWINCETETAEAFAQAGGNPEIVHIEDIIENKSKLKNYQILVFPGGFSYGDHTGSGKVLANKVKAYMFEQVRNFVEDDKLVLGICNGFQVLIQLWLLPAVEKKYWNIQAALIPNDEPVYLTRWVDLKIINNNSPWLRWIESLSVPIAHWEWKFYTTSEILSKIKEQNLIAMQYYSWPICKFFDLQANPNGSLEDIAALIDPSWKILGMMPHPERAIRFTQLPYWTLLQTNKENYDLPQANGLQIFQNAVRYFKM